MSDTKNPYGSVNVAPKAIATIAYQAAVETYGVVGLASKNLVNGLTHMLVRDPSHGIVVDFKEDEINIDLYIVVQYGTRIKSVATSVASTVRYKVEKSLGLPLNEINVHVQGLRFTEEE